MLLTSPQTAPILQSDVMALDALFKRIAERGRKIRTQTQPIEPKPTAGNDLQKDVTHEKQSS